MRLPGDSPRGAARVPAPALFVVSGLTQYTGAALAVGLFVHAGAAQVAWARVVVAALVLLAVARPWRQPWTAARLRSAALFGTVLAAMNVTFYLSIERLPLGTAVAIEFVGPVAVAAVTGRGWRERVGMVLAGLGVVALAGVTVAEGPEAVAGLVWIGLAAACWAGYIVLGRRVATAGPGLGPLAVAMAAGAVVFAPLLARDAVPLAASPRLAAALVGVAVLSSVIPYGREQVVPRRVSSATFAILLALLPASAMLVGAVVLRQLPHPVDVAGLLAVSVAIALTGSAPGAGRRSVPAADALPGDGDGDPVSAPRRSG